MVLAELRERSAWRTFSRFLKVLRLRRVRQRHHCNQGRQRTNRRTCGMDLPTVQVADPALVDFHITVIHRFRLRRRGIGMLVVSEVERDRHLLQCAIGRCRGKSGLERQQHEEEKDEEAAHGKIIAELPDDLEGDASSRSRPGGPAAPAWFAGH